MINAILNGEPCEVSEEMSFEEICKAAGVKPKAKSTVVYSIRHGGVFHLLPGEKAMLTEGAVINVGA